MQKRVIMSLWRIKTAKSTKIRYTLVIRVFCSFFLSAKNLISSLRLCDFFLLRLLNAEIH